MERQFILSCGSTVDLPYAYMESRNIPVIFYSYFIGEEEHVDDMLRDPQALPNFYTAIKTQMPRTSQINTYRYVEFFDELLQKGGFYAELYNSQFDTAVS